MLDFLKKPEWQIVKKEFINYEKIKEIEEEYWWIDENEVSPELVDVDEFYFNCLKVFKKIAQDEGYLNNSDDFCLELIPVGEKVVFEALYDRYLVQRHESDPDIFYNYVMQLSVEAGMTLSNKWLQNQRNFEKYVDKIIRETSFDYVEKLYEKYFHIDAELDKIEFINKFDKASYDLLKWYRDKDDFETYKLKALLAGFSLGVNIIAEKHKSR